MSRQPPRYQRKRNSAIIEAPITRLGAQGDGVAAWQGRPLFVPFALPGEWVRVEITRKTRDGAFGQLLEILEPAPQRIEPSCRHFGICGGCAIQHLTEDAAAAWKRQRVIEALHKRGLSDVAVEKTVCIAPGSRRRATFAYRSRKRGAVIGFNQRASDRLVDLAECPVIDESLFSLIGPLRELLAAITPPGTSGDIQVSKMDDGLDVIVDLPELPGLSVIEALTGFGRENGLMRLSWRCRGRTEPVATYGRAVLTVGEAEISPPPGAFLQPSAEGEEVISERVLAAIGDSEYVADLFCGIGTFSLRMVPDRRGYAADGDAELIGALAATGKVETEVRDLFRRPLVAAELSRFDAVIFDPPRAGARAQAGELATAGAETVVAVSCNPATFARDARLLVDGGYGMESVTPIDQFPWSGHVELVAVFRR
ncbi:MAG: class I SAM-dependent RNA methyltransferase [Rhodospirillales bacterium]|nr:class I SAM-dependent RNA methyltransferase [Rhodospirillales bacterium]